MPTETALPKGAHLARAIGLFRQGRYDRMEAELRAELAADPEDHEALTWLGLALLKLGREDEALQATGDAIRCRPDHADAHYVRARVLHQKLVGQRLMGAILAAVGASTRPDTADLAGQVEAALAEAIRLAPNSPEYLDFVADLRREQGRYDEALEVAERGLAVDPHHVGCLYNRALILDRLDRRDEAEAAYRAGLAVAPEHAGLHRHLGELLLGKNAAGPAVEHLREALRLQPDLEADLRPVIAVAMKRRSPAYAWLADHIASPWLLTPLLALPLAALLVGESLTWRVTEVMSRDLIAPMGYLLLLFSVVSAIDPLCNLALARTPFGRLMLTPTDVRQGRAVGVCLLAFLAAAAWAVLMPDKVTPVFLALFCLFWIAPVADSFTLYPRSLQRIATMATGLSVACVLAHLAWRWFGDEATFAAYYPWAMALLGVGYFLLLVPFILSRASGEFSAWRPPSRRRAVVWLWALLLVAWFVLVAGNFAAYFAPDDASFAAIRRSTLLAGVGFGMVLFFEDALIAWFDARLR